MTGSGPSPRGISRRAAIGAGAGALAASVLGIPALAGWRGKSSTGIVLRSKIPLPPPFHRALAMPPVLTPSRRADGADVYHVRQYSAPIEVVPGYQTTVWTYGGTFPGPTIRSTVGRRTVVTHTNELPVPTVVHLHGGVTPPEHDGYPTDLILPDDSWRGYGHARDITVRARTYEYPLQQRACTLWYHDHRMDFTGPAVWRGLAGFHLVTDPDEERLDLPSGPRELPLALMDRAFDADGQFLYPSLDPDLVDPPGVRHPYESGMLGDVILVNGRAWPYHPVDTALYRLRFLNASNARRYRLRCEVDGDEADLPFIQIGSDHGLLAEPVQHDALTIAPAERFDVLVDFRSLRPGARVRVVNDLGAGTTADVMRFDVARSVRDVREVPDVLSGNIERLREADAVRTRAMNFRSQSIDGMHGWVVNGKPFDPHMAHATVELGSIEIWELTGDFHHPIHLHLSPFQVLGRGTGGPGPFDSGWKDTIDLRPAESARIIVRFDGYRGRYVFHCHNLEHEDMMMMANFDVV